MRIVEEENIVLQDQRQLSHLVGSYEPLALRLIHEKTIKLPAYSARNVLVYYWALIELVNMNGSGKLISNSLIERFSRIDERRQKEPRDFLISIGLLEIHNVMFKGSGARKRISYNLLRAPRQVKKEGDFGEFSTGAGSSKGNREEVREEAPLESFPQGPVPLRGTYKGFKEKLNKNTSYFCGDPQEVMTPNEKNVTVRSLGENEEAAKTDVEEKPPTVEEMKKVLLARGDIDHKKAVGYLAGVLLNGVVNKAAVMNGEKPVNELYRQIGILRSKFETAFLVEIFERWTTLPVGDKGLNLIAPATMAYPYWTAEKQVEQAEQLKKEGTILPNEQLRRAMEGHYA